MSEEKTTERTHGRQKPFARNLVHNEDLESLMDSGLYEKKLSQWGLQLFPWQLFVLKVWLSVDAGKFAYLACALTVARQNGKTRIIMARILLGCILFKENQLYTAQIKLTAGKVYREIRELIESNANLRKYFPGAALGSDNPNTMEIYAVDPKTGKRLGSCRFITRNSSSPARGDTISVTYFDEAQILNPKIYNSISPASLTNENGQEFFVGTASSVEEAATYGKQGSIASAGTFFMDMRNNIKSGRKSNACWLEWGVDRLTDMDDVDAILDSNPSVGFKMADGKSVTVRRIQNFQGSIEAFNTEHLGYWPSQAKDRAIDVTRWDELTVSRLPKIEGPVRTAVAIKTNSAGGLDICVAARTEETTYLHLLPQISMADSWTDQVWLAIKDYVKSTSCKSIVIDGRDGQFEILEKLALKGHWNMAKGGKSQRKISLASPLDMSQATSTIITATIEKSISPIEQPVLRAAVEDAGKRSARGGGGAQGFNSMSGRVDVNCLEAAALALHATKKQKMPSTPNPDADKDSTQASRWGQSIDWGQSL